MLTYERKKGESHQLILKLAKAGKKHAVTLKDGILLLITAGLALRHSTERVTTASSIFIVPIDEVIICII